MDITAATRHGVSATRHAPNLLRHTLARSQPITYVTSSFIGWDGNIWFSKRSTYVLSQGLLTGDNPTAAVPPRLWEGYPPGVIDCFAILTFLRQRGIRHASQRCRLCDWRLGDTWDVLWAHVTGWNFHRVQRSLTVPSHSPNGRQMPAVGAVQGDCERVISWRPYCTATQTPNCTLGAAHFCIGCW